MSSVEYPLMAVKVELNWLQSSGRTGTTSVSIAENTRANADEEASKPRYQENNLHIGRAECVPADKVQACFQKLLASLQSQ